jgi:hypothetical protein
MLHTARGRQLGSNKTEDVVSVRKKGRGPDVSASNVACASLEVSAKVILAGEW